LSRGDQRGGRDQKSSEVAHVYKMVDTRPDR
jgi:hypothetical protein